MIKDCGPPMKTKISFVSYFQGRLSSLIPERMAYLLAYPLPFSMKYLDSRLASGYHLSLPYGGKVLATRPRGSLKAVRQEERV